MSKAAAPHSASTSRGFWRALCFRANGRPKKPLRKLLFRNDGQPRSAFRSVVLHTDGTPRAAFATWMASGAYQALPAALRAKKGESFLQRIELSPQGEAMLTELTARMNGEQ